MDTTTNYGLKKPAQTDNYNVDDFNENADLIDTQMKANADAAAAASTAATAAQSAIDNMWEVVSTW